MAGEIKEKGPEVHKRSQVMGATGSVVAMAAGLTEKARAELEAHTSGQCWLHRSRLL